MMDDAFNSQPDTQKKSQEKRVFLVVAVAVAVLTLLLFVVAVFAFAGRSPSRDVTDEDITRKLDVNSVLFGLRDYARENERQMPENKADFQEQVLENLDLRHAWRRIDYETFSATRFAEPQPWPINDDLHIWLGAKCQISTSKAPNYGVGSASILQSTSSEEVAIVYRYAGSVICLQG